MWRTGVHRRVCLMVACLMIALPAMANDGDDFSSRVAGSYFMETPDGLIAMTVVNADGTWQGQDTTDFGADGGFLNGEVYGAWEKTGSKETTWTGVFLVYDNPDSGIRGNLALIARTRVVLEHSKEFDSFTGQFVTQAFLPTDDPLDPDAIPVIEVGPFDIEGRRITVIPPAP